MMYRVLTAALLVGVSCWADAQTKLPDPLAAGWQGQSVCEQLHDDEHQRVLRCTFPPGVGHEKHYHVQHFGYCLSGGRMRLTDANGTREVSLATGSSYHSEGTEWHEVLNIGDTEVVYLIIEPKSPTIVTGSSM